ncbi:MAG: 6-pyruvoyl trahydropterin synthase family protein [Chloroflexota bacterium]
MFEVGVVGQFEAAHRLRGDFGPARRLHGHTYRVEVAARGQALGPDGTLCDLGTLQAAVQRVVDGLTYRDLDEVPAFQGINTTAEAVARYLHREIAREVGAHLTARGVRSLVVQVWESPLAWAGYEAELG